MACQPYSLFFSKHTGIVGRGFFFFLKKKKKSDLAFRAVFGLVWNLRSAAGDRTRRRSGRREGRFTDADLQSVGMLDLSAIKHLLVSWLVGDGVEGGVPNLFGVTGV
jgi:hypothetical protein